MCTGLDDILQAVAVTGLDHFTEMSERRTSIWPWKRYLLSHDNMYIGQQMQRSHSQSLLILKSDNENNTITIVKILVFTIVNTIMIVGYQFMCTTIINKEA